MTQFLMIFIPFIAIIGIVFIPIAICREDEGKGLVGFFKGLAITLAFGLVFSFGLFAQAKDNDNKWNEGLCPNCSVEWEFGGASQYRNSKTYYYNCPECEKVIEIKK